MFYFSYRILMELSLDHVFLTLNTRMLALHTLGSRSSYESLSSFHRWLWVPGNGSVDKRATSNSFCAASRTSYLASLATNLATNTMSLSPVTTILAIVWTVEPLITTSMAADLRLFQTRLFPNMFFISWAARLNNIRKNSLYWTEQTSTNILNRFLDQTRHFWFMLFW